MNDNPNDNSIESNGNSIEKRKGREEVAKYIGICGSRIISILSGILATILIIYSGYVIYDSIFVQQSAFSSWDLTRYRPIIKEGRLSFEALQKINPDTVGWLLIDKTHIDYPVLQGEDDMEYINKDVFGNTSISGSIFLTCINTRDFTNSYNLIYGHHMANGAMFGDIENFEDYDYFYGHQDGILITTIGVYDLHVFARIGADAYDSKIYSAGDKKSEDFPAFLEYVQSLAIQWDPTTDVYDITDRVRTYLLAREANIAENGKFTWEKMPADAIDNGLQLLALSTCADAVTNGRQLLFATMKLRTEPLPPEVLGKSSVEGVERTSHFGIPIHGSRDYWSLVNLICTILTFFVLVPLMAVKAKYSRLRMVRRLNDAGDEEYNEQKTTLGTYIGLVLEICLVVLAIILFISYEDFHHRMTVVDDLSPLFIAIFAGCFAVDVLLFRYRRKKKEEEDDSEADTEDENETETDNTIETDTDNDIV